MRYKTMGSTGVQVSVIGLGGNTFGSPVDERGTRAVIDKAEELGVNFIDTAESYSQSETLLGKALAGRRDRFVLATKTGAQPAYTHDPGGRLTRKSLIEHLEASLRRLGTDYVDVYYFHSPDPSTPLEESLRTIDDLVRAGKIRYLGLSNYAGWEIARATSICDRRGYVTPAVAQASYNLLHRSVESELVPACAHFGISLVPHSPLARGFLTGKYVKGRQPPTTTRYGRNPRPGGPALIDDNFNILERYRNFASARGHSVGELALAWLASNPVVCAVIAGSTTPEQVAENAKAAEWVLSPEDLKELPDEHLSDEAARVR